jgi:hypothetical protein
VGVVVELRRKKKQNKIKTPVIKVLQKQIYKKSATKA